jgi:hypothetical protein
MAASKASKTKRPALLPVNVPGVVRELHQLTAVSNAATPAQKPSKDSGRSLVVRGK